MAAAGGGDGDELVELALRMRAGLAAKTRDRLWRDLRTYRQCFLGADAIAWLRLELRSNEADAVERGNRLVARGWLNHVTREHALEPGGRTLYYRWDHEALERASARRRTGAEEELRSEIDALRTQVSRLAEGAREQRDDLAESLARAAVLEHEVRALARALAVAVFVLAAVAASGSRLCGALVALPAGCAVHFAVRRAGVRSRRSLVRLARETSMLAHAVRGPSLADLRGDIDGQSDDARDCAVGRAGGEEEGGAPMPAAGVRALRRAMTRRSRAADGEEEDLLGPLWGMRTSVPPPSAWPNRPVFFCVNTAVPGMVAPSHGAGPLPLGVPVPFESELFEGSVLLRLRDVPSEDPRRDGAYFANRKRRMHAVVQGRFKEEVSLAEAVSGHEFERPLRRLPPQWVLSAASAFIRKLAPGARIDLLAELPRVYALLGATAQTISVEAPGMEPDILGLEFAEENTLLGGRFARGDVSAAKRKRTLTSLERAAMYTFDTESVYTFDFYQHLFDAATYSLDVGFTTLGMSACLDGQPVQVMAKTTDGRYLYSFLIFHEQLLVGV